MATENKDKTPDYLKNITPIGLERLRQTIPATFSEHYLNLISMIQGVALGALAYQFTQFYNNREILAYIALTLMVMTIVWEEYVLSTIEFWWRISWLDTFIPFCLGFGEFAMIGFINKPRAWYFSLAVTALFGLGAHGNLKFRLKKEYFEESIREKAYTHFQKYHNWRIAMLFAFLVLFLIIGILNKFVYGWQYIWITVTFVTLVVFILHRHLWWRKSLILYGWKEKQG